MTVRIKQQLPICLTAGLVTLLSLGSILNPNLSNRLFLSNGIYLNGLRSNRLTFNTSKYNALGYNGATVNSSVQPDWITPSTTQTNTNEAAGIGEQKGQLIITVVE